jgi:hypothetical protein
LAESETERKTFAEFSFTWSKAARPVELPHRDFRRRAITVPDALAVFALLLCLWATI